MWQNPQQQQQPSYNNQQNFYPPPPLPPVDPYQHHQQQQFGGAPYPAYNPAYPHQTNPAPQQQQSNMYNPYQDSEGGDKNFDFDDQSIRRGFIRKVYSILCVQLSISLGFIAVFVFHDGTKLWIQHHPEMVWIALGVLIVTMIALVCCDSVRRNFPMNFIFLGIFTLAQSFLLGCTSARYAQQEIFMAVGITAAVCFGLTLFAFQTKWDFTMLSGVLFVAVIVLMLFGIIAMFFPGKTITLVYASLGALLFCIYLIYDTQLMMGGKHKYSISSEEYIFAALNLYLDIVNIFIYILTIIGASRD